MPFTAGIKAFSSVLFRRKFPRGEKIKPGKEARRKNLPRTRDNEVSKKETRNRSQNVACFYQETESYGVTL